MPHPDTGGVWRKKILTGNSCQGNLRLWLQLWRFGLTSLPHVCGAQQHDTVSFTRMRRRLLQTCLFVLTPPWREGGGCVVRSTRVAFVTRRGNCRDLLARNMQTWTKERYQKVFFFFYFQPRKRHQIKALCDAHHQRFGHSTALLNFLSLFFQFIYFSLHKLPMRNDRDFYLAVQFSFWTFKCTFWRKTIRKFKETASTAHYSLLCFPKQIVKM